MSLVFVPMKGPLILVREAGQGSPGEFLHGVKFLGTAIDELGTGWVSLPPFYGPMQPNFRGHGVAVELLNINMDVPLGPVAIRYAMGVGSIPAWDTKQQREYVQLERKGIVLPYGLQRTCKQSGWKYEVYKDSSAPGFLGWLEDSDWSALAPLVREKNRCRDS